LVVKSLVIHRKGVNYFSLAKNSQGGPGVYFSLLTL
jgi:hypothetical protein